MDKNLEKLIQEAAKVLTLVKVVLILLIIQWGVTLFLSTLALRSSF